MKDIDHLLKKTLRLEWFTQLQYFKILQDFPKIQISLFSL